jgi:hypothetical protein
LEIVTSCLGEEFGLRTFVPYEDFTFHIVF